MDQDAKIFTPGPITSGLRICGVTVLGPLELNAAITGDGFTFTTVPPKLRTAVGFFAVFAYSLIASPVFIPTATVGNVWLSATSSSPLASVFAIIIPTPPASFTTKPFSTLAFEPRSHKTTFPLTNLGSSEPRRHKLPELSVPELKIAIDCSGADGHDPGSDISDGRPNRAAVPGGTGNENSSLHSGERSHCDGVAVVRNGAAAERHGEDVDAVEDRLFYSGENIGAEAAGFPANLICSDARVRGHATRHPRGVTEKAGVSHVRPRCRAGSPPGSAPACSGPPNARTRNPTRETPAYESYADYTPYPRTPQQRRHPAGAPPPPPHPMRRRSHDTPYYNYTEARRNHQKLIEDEQNTNPGESRKKTACRHVSCVRCRSSWSRRLSGPGGKGGEGQKWE
nr:hypothetical protein CKAN_02524000 [Ipomoea batatas]